MKLRVLLVEDSESDAALVQRALERGGHQVVLRRVETGDTLSAELTRERWDAVISDFSLPQFNGLAALAMVKQRRLDIPFLIVSGTVGEDVAVTAMKAGAHDYVMKSNLTRLAASLEREVKEAQVRQERGALEEQLRQAQKMEAVGQLAGGVAHDFNNLLTAILSFSRFAYDDLGADHPTREDLQEVIECAERAAALTRQLLAVSRRQVFQPQLLDMSGILSNAEKLLRRLIAANITLEVRAEPKLWYVRADPGHIEQIVLNLVVNARDAMPQGGTLTLELKNVELDESYARGHLGGQPGPFVMLAVSDTGVGMTEEVQAHLFEPFFTTKGPGKGTGLGLATVYGIVKQCGGDILIESAVGKGATFRIYFPRSEEVEEPEAAPTLTRRPSRVNEAVMIVEDEDAVRAVARRALQTAGYTVVEATKPGEALARLEAHDGPLDLVLADVVLPEMSGKELVDRLRQVQPTLKALLMSGYAASGSTPSTSGGSLPYLQKPFTPELLVQRVRAVLDGETGRR